MIRDSVMPRRLRRLRGIYIFWSCLERQKRKRRKNQSWGETWGFRQIITTFIWLESRGRGGYTVFNVLGVCAKLLCIWLIFTTGLISLLACLFAFVSFSRQEYLNKELYTNKPTKEYFCQFNTTSRWHHSDGGKKGPFLDRLFHVFHFSGYDSRFRMQPQIVRIDGPRFFCVNKEQKKRCDFCLVWATGVKWFRLFKKNIEEETDCSTCFIFQSYFQLQW